jgi:transposase
MSNFRPINRDTGFLLPPSVDEWLPQLHLARFVVEVIDGLDLSELVKTYRGSGSASYHPAAMLLGLMVYRYATKVFSSRAIFAAAAMRGPRPMLGSGRAKSSRPPSWRGPPL